jgi:hypothetical protein
MVAAVVALASPHADARVSGPSGRAPKPPPPNSLQSPRMWQDRDGVFALEKPKSDRWSFRSGMKGPDGAVVPLWAVSQESGAQVVVQSTDGIGDLRTLARLLSQNLGDQQGVQVEDVERMIARGGEAFAFSYSVSDEVRGRVAVVRTGDRVALVVASWPMGAPPEVADEIEEMIGTLGPVPGFVPGTY